jgi:pimeloyl-ACP methyl ester carboxylesterase
MKILSLSGWLQPTDTMQEAFPQAQPVCYDTLPNIQAVAEALAVEKPDAVIGWSLGGVLALQALQHAECRPKKIIILGSPFQFMASAEVPEGAKLEDYESIRSGYEQDPMRLARRLQGAVNAGMTEDSLLCPLAPNAEDKAAWMPWLMHLKESSFGSLTEQGEVRSGGERSVGGLPPVELLVIHGGLDMVVSPAQAKYWNRIFPKVQVMILPQASHAPHIQAKELVQHAVTEFLNA